MFRDKPERNCDKSSHSVPPYFGYFATETAIEPPPIHDLDSMWDVHRDSVVRSREALGEFLSKG